MEYDNKKIGQRINELLALRGKKQKDLAKHLGVAQNIISYFIKGTRTPNTQQIFKIATFLNTPSDYLLGLTECKKIDTDLQGVCDYTGLSEEAIENIKGIPDYTETYMNDFIAQMHFKKILANILFLLSVENELNVKYKEYAELIENKLNKPVSDLLNDYSFSNRLLLSNIMGDLINDFLINETDEAFIVDLLDNRESTLYRLSKTYDAIIEAVVKNNILKQGAEENK